MNDPIEILYKPASGDTRHAVSVVTTGTAGAAISAKGGGPLLDLRNSSDVSMFAVSQAGAVSGSAISVASPTFTGTTTVTKLVPTVATLTDAATIATNAALGNYFRCAAVAGNRDLGVPTNPTDGQSVWWELTASGAQRTITLIETAGGFLLTDIITGETAVIPQNKTALINAVYSATVSKWIVVHKVICE